VLNFVGFEMKPEDKREISSIARDSGGKIGEIEQATSGPGSIIHATAT
jgi:hypothetical protein